MTFDRIDREILRILEADSSLSNLGLAARVNLSPTACARRVKRLEDTAVILGYRAILSPAKMDEKTIVYTHIGLHEHTKTALKDFEARLIRHRQVKELYIVSGHFEYIAKIQTKDVADYKVFHTEILSDIDNVAKISTIFVLEALK
jgi:Lrp/AsnC family leucine-responsive transcriptional regulator